MIGESRPRPVPERIVRPRKPTHTSNLPLVAVTVLHGHYLTEEGEIGELDKLYSQLRSREPTLFACDNSGSFLAECHKRFDFDPTWQYGASELHRQVYSPRARLRVHDIGVAVSFFGWRNYSDGGRKRQKRNDYHLAIDPQVFSGNRTGLALDELLSWAKELRDFCVANGLQLRPTGGAIARQLLRDPRFYPEPRRKVPKATNQRARIALPGNLYEERTEKGKEYDAYYLDQEKCHHYHASTLDLPNANTLRAYGHFNTLTGMWRENPARVRKFLSQFHGLLYVEIYWSRRHRDSDMFLPPCLESYRHDKDAGPKRCYVWTCELDMLAYYHVHIRGIIAAWGSYSVDTGLRKYAEWAMEQPPSPVVKPLLLSAYGVLATAARKRRMVYAKTKSKKATDVSIRVPYAGFLTGKSIEMTTATEPSTNNVIHRGMIEAATRTECIMLAELLRTNGHNVLAIYADSVFVERDLSTPINGDFKPWRNKHHLSRLQFLSPNAFTAYDVDAQQELRKIPGGSDRRIGHRPGARPLVRKTPRKPRGDRAA